MLILPTQVPKYKPKAHVRDWGTQNMMKAGKTDCTLKAQLECCHPYFTDFSISALMMQVESHVLKKI